MRKYVVSMLPLAVAVAACSQFPELDEAVSESARNAPYAKLVPIETLQASAPTAAIEDSAQDDLEVRVAKLKGRATALQTDVLDEASQSRLQNAVE